MSEIKFIIEKDSANTGESHYYNCGDYNTAAMYKLMKSSFERDEGVDSLTVLHYHSKGKPCGDFDCHRVEKDFFAPSVPGIHGHY